MGDDLKSHYEELDKLFEIPWMDLPLGGNHPDYQTPGYGNTSLNAVVDHLYKKLKDYFPEMEGISSGYEEVIKNSLMLGVGNANPGRVRAYPKHPPRVSPNFVHFSMPLQTSYYLGGHKLTAQDRVFFQRTQREMAKHPAYIAFREMRDKEIAKEKQLRQKWGPKIKVRNIP